MADYAYTDTLDGSDIGWSVETINALFDLCPDYYIPGTKMPMQRIVKQDDQDDLISYLRRATAKEENLSESHAYRVCGDCHCRFGV